MPLDLNVSRCKDNSDSINICETDGPWGYLMYIGNCHKDEAGNYNCDINLNYRTKKHVCKQVGSITECLYSNPESVWENNVNITDDLTRIVDPTGTWDTIIQDDRSINDGEVIMLQQRLVRPCSKNVGDIYVSPQEPGCLPYSNSLISSKVGDGECSNGESLCRSCCSDETCGTKTCQNPNALVIDNLPLEEDLAWKDEIQYFSCPSYLFQRQYMFDANHYVNNTNVQEDDNYYYPNNNSMCNPDYALLCELTGSVVDKDCQIYWGGLLEKNPKCTLLNLDCNLCNSSRSDLCSNDLVCETEGVRGIGCFCKDYRFTGEGGSYNSDGGVNLCESEGLCPGLAEDGVYYKQCLSSPTLNVGLLPHVSK